jgi:hypothetical protein
MQPASLRKDLLKLSEKAPNGKTRGRVCALTRHPTALATAQAFLLTLRLPGYVRLLAEILVTRCDREGLYWGKVTGELRELTRLSPNRIRVAARELRKLGLVEWEWAKAWRHYPRRVSYHEPAEWRPGVGGPKGGEKTGHGGRVWVVRWENFGVNFRSRILGTKSGRLILEDQSRLIPEDQSTDPSRSLSENVSPIPHSPEMASAIAPALPAPMTEIGPPLRSALGPDESAAPAAPKVASETPAAPDVTHASPSDPTIEREPESAKGVRASRPRPRLPLPDFLADLERRFGEKGLLTTADDLQNRPKRE